MELIGWEQIRRVMSDSKYLTAPQAAARLGVSATMVRRLCGQGRMQGAELVGAEGSVRVWRIPSPPVVLSALNAGREGEFQNAAQVAEQMGVSRQRVIELLKSSRIKGARKVGQQWAIPVPVKIVYSPPGRPQASTT